MSSWLDRWARRAAEATPSSAQDAVAPTRPASPASRRDFLKKAGIVGGVAWSVPVLQTVMAPAASASNGTLLGNNCPAGNVSCAGGTAFCATTAPFRCGGLGATCGACASGAGTCSNATCGGGGGTCTPANQATTCVSGVCTGITCRALAGAACSTNAHCLSGTCTGGTCAPGALGAACTGTGTTQCATSGGLAVACNGSTCGGLGATCTSANTATQCATVGGATVSCSNGATKTCGGPGGNNVGALCATPADPSPVCSGNNECKSYGGNPNRCK